MFEKRRNERYEISDDKLEYVLTPFSEDEIFEAGVINFNQTGICILSKKLISAGQEIIIKHFMDVSSQTAVAVWVKKCDDIFYLDKSDEELFKIGLLFI